MHRSLFSLAFLLVTAGATFASAPELKYVPRQILVKFQPGYDDTSKLYHTAIGAKVIHKNQELGIETLKIPAGMTVSQAVSHYNNLAGVKFAEPNGIYEATALPNDPFLNQQYSVGNMRVNLVWDLTQSQSNVIIGVLDTGVDYNHEDLVGKIIKGHEYINNDNDPMDDVDHGTHVAGICAANTNNGVGVAGIGYNSMVYAGKVLGPGGGSWEALADGITDATNYGVDVINMSLGGYFDSAAVNTAVDYAASKNVVLIAAAGNYNLGDPFYPAANPKIIAVGATDSADQKSGFSNFGNWVDVAAPGSGILSTIPNNQYASFDGTSMASPNASGVAGLLIAYAGKGNVTADEVRFAMESTTRNVGTWLTYGLLDANAAIAKIKPPIVVTAYPTAVTRFTGLSSTGTVASLNADDGQYFAVTSKTVKGLGTVAAAKITYRYDQPADLWLSGKVTVRASAAKNVTTTAYLQRNDGEYVLLKSWLMRGTETETTLNLPADMSQFLNRKKFKIVIRGVLPARLSPNASWSLNLDKATTEIKYAKS
jgi:thermitase